MWLVYLTCLKLDLTSRTFTQQQEECPYLTLAMVFGLLDQDNSFHNLT